MDIRERSGEKKKGFYYSVNFLCSSNYTMMKKRRKSTLVLALMRTAIKIRSVLGLETLIFSIDHN